MKRLLLLPLLLFTKHVFSQADTTHVKLINPSSVTIPKGYSQVAQIDLGSCKMLLLSGQVALNPHGDLIGEDNFGKQADQAFLNIKNIVESVGGTMGNIVKLNYYVIDVSQVQTLRQIRDKYVVVNNPPASTLVQVSALFRKDILIEIEATAIIPNKSSN